MASLNLNQPTPAPSALGERPILLSIILALFFGVGALFYFPAFQAPPTHRLTRVAVNSGRPVQAQFANSAITSDSLTKQGSSKPGATAGTIQNLPANEYGSQLKTLTQAAPESKAAETTDILVSFPAAAPAHISEAGSGTIEAGSAPQSPESEAISVRSPSTADVREEKPAPDDKADPGEGIANSQPPAKLAPELEGKMVKRASVLMDQNDIAGARLILNYLANHGSASAAFALAETFDAKKWSGRHVTGMTSDAELANKWYTLAAALGSDDAAVKLLGKDKP